MNESTLNLSPDLALPVAAVTSKLAFFGGNGAGKSYAAMKLAEEMWDAGAQFISFDPVGIWFGLRIGNPGIPFAVFGGLHGDIPIAPHDGRLAISDRLRSSIIRALDLSSPPIFYFRKDLNERTS